MRLCAESLKIHERVDIFFAVFHAAFKSQLSDARPQIFARYNFRKCATWWRHGRNLNQQFSLQFNCQITVTREKRAKPSAAARRLDNWFTENFKNPYPTTEQKHQLVSGCGTAMKQVCTLRFTVLRSHSNVCLQIKYYFGERRMREKRKALRTKKQLGEDNKNYDEKRWQGELGVCADREVEKYSSRERENIAQGRRGPETSKKSPDGSCSEMIQQWWERWTRTECECHGSMNQPERVEDCIYRSLRRRASVRYLLHVLLYLFRSQMSKHRVTVVLL